MDVTVYWKRLTSNIWRFRVGNHLFSCSTLSINKKRRPVRVFLGFSHYRPLNKYGYEKMGNFMVEERERHIKTIKP